METGQLHHALESRFFQQLLALVEIVRDPARFNITLPRVADEPQFVVTDIGSQIDLALAAELARLAPMDPEIDLAAQFPRIAPEPERVLKLALESGILEQGTLAAADRMSCSNSRTWGSAVTSSPIQMLLKNRTPTG